MRRLAVLFGLAALLAPILALAPPAKAADEPAFISFGGAVFGYPRERDQQPEFRLEYRGEKMWGDFKPVLAAAGTVCPGGIGGMFNFCPGDSFSGSGFFGAGTQLDVFLGRRVVFSPSVTANLYTGGNADLDLDAPIVFRFQVELAYRFDNRSRLGVAISHYDNLELGSTNPGAESVTVYFSYPLTGWFGH